MGKCIIGFFIAAMLVCISGCETTKNVAFGLGKGLVDDTVNTYNALRQADRWMTEHYW
ncbi:MAG: hypothetical protein WCI77_04010 [Candidatus Omnitrophota bacterium]